MKKTFGIMGTGLLLVSNVLMSFSNVSFALQDGYDIEIETNGCYVYEHYFRPTKRSASSYLGSKLVSYKCDAEGGTVDLREFPLGDSYYIASIGEDAFSGTNVTKVIMPSTVEYIGEGAFCSVKKEGGPVCGNGIIESGEECDDGNDDGNGYTRCTLNCTIMDLPNCGNGQEDLGETCGNCPEDVYCGKSINGSENPESGESEFLFKAQLPIEPDRSDFVVLDFPDGRNGGLQLSDLDDACAKLQEYTITFVTEDGVNLGTGETINQYVNSRNIPEAPEKEGFYGAWYLGDEIFDINTHITDDVTLVYKYVKGGIDRDDENGWIRVKLGDQEIVIKDKDQGAEKSIRKAVPEWYFDYVEYGNSLLDSYNNGDITYDERDNSLLEWANAHVGSFSDFAEFEDYLQHLQNIMLMYTLGNYYFWGNNVGMSARKALFDEETQSIDTSKLNNLEFPEGFDHGYIGLTGGNDWTVGSNDTPCNADSGEYLPSPDDWKFLIQMWGEINGYELNYTEGEYDEYWFDEPDFTNKAAMDFGIIALPAARVNQNQVSFAFGPIYQIYQGAYANGKIGYLTSEGLLLLNTSNLNGDENNIAMPVRCFVKSQFEVSFEANGGNSIESQKVFSGDNAVEPETQKENAEFLGWYTVDGNKFDFSTPITSDVKLYAKWQENKSSNGYSGGGGGKSSSKTSENTEKAHNVADEKTSIQQEEKEVVVNKDENKSENKADEIQQKVVYVPNKSLPEMEQAYDFSHSYGITTKTSVQNAKMNTPLTRIQMAKMLSNYAMNVMGKYPDVSKGTIKFNDVTNKMDKQYDNGVTLAYQFGIMGINMPNNNFRPNDEVTRAEFVTALSRLLYGTSDGGYKSTSKYYEPHMAKLYGEGIINKADPTMKEKRGYVMLMLMRSAK